MILKNRQRQLNAYHKKRSIKTVPNEKADWSGRNFLTIAPALPFVSGIRTQTPRLIQKSATIISTSNENGCFGFDSCGAEMAPHDVVFLQTTPDGKIQASRSQKDKEKNPDRICLDRRGLTHLPNFVGEKNIRLLSLQHNLINRLDGIQNLRIHKLVFLDLYNNQIEKIFGLELFENLRVLLIGKNRLKKIEGLKNLTKLEVLDLHGNQITYMSGLNSLSDLKVLNLAGNQIRTVGENDLEGLLSLQELNLKRNRLRKVLGLNGPTNLEKLLLSNNEILSIDDMIGISAATSLREVTIDSNPVAVSNECVHLLVSFLPKLQVLSHMQVTEQVRRNALTWRKNRENSAKAQVPEVEVTRGEVISNARTNWELLRRQTKCFPSCLMTSSLRDLRTIDLLDSSVDKLIQSDSVLSVASSMTLSSRDSLAKNSKLKFASKRSVSEETGDVESSEPIEFFKLPPILASLANEKKSSTSDTSKCEENSADPELPFSNASEGTADQESETDSGNVEEVDCDSTKRSKSATPSGKSANRKERPSTAKNKTKNSVIPTPGKVREQGGDYLIEICGRNLNVYGQGALRFIDRPWNPLKAGDVTTVRFNYVSYGGICNILGKLKQRFPNAENFIFRETNITCLGQLNALADVQGLSSLQIDEEGNPITEKNWRNYAIYRLAHWGLKTINGKEINEEDLAEVAQEYQGLSDLVLWSLPETLLQPLLSRLRIDGIRSNPQQSAKQWLRNAEPALRSVVVKEALQWRRGTQDDLYWKHKGKNHLNYIIELTCSAAEKLQLFETRWPKILHQMIRDTLVDYSHIDSYMKNCIQEL